MKTILLLLTFSFSAFATEYSAGMYESYFVPNNYFFGSDSSARIRKALKNKGFESFTVNTRMNLFNSSFIAHPRLKSSITNLETMISLIRFGNGATRIKPTLMQGEIKTPALSFAGDSADARVLLASYQREMARYLTLSRKTSFEELVVGSGVGVLYQQNAKGLTNFHRYLKASKSEETSLTLNLDSVAIVESMNSELIKSINESFDAISYVIEDSETLSLEIGRIIDEHNRKFSGLKIKIASVVIPSDKEIGEVVNTLAGFNLDSIEFVMATTDYEPDNAQNDFYYYRGDSFFLISDLELEILPALPIRKKLKPRVCIYFDLLDTVEKKDRLGRIHSTMLTSLMGAFPEYSAERTELGKYEAGDLQDCDKAFYLATHFSAKIPAEFLTDVKEYVKSHDFMWMNYKISELEMDELSFQVPYVLLPEKEPTQDDYDIGFYQYFDYKGETFFKKKSWSGVSNNFASSPEVHYVIVNDKSKVEVLATARHNKTNQEIPYVVKQDIEEGSLWYIADSPFSFVHYEDRYLIVTDLLWDFLEVEAPQGAPKALVRIEDVNPSVEMPDLNWAMTYMYQEDVPFSLATIPYFSDIAGATQLNNYKPLFAPITRFEAMKASLKLAKNLNADFVYHGVAHQVDDFISGYTGVSGSDYEFWLYPENKPIPYDSVDWVMDRLEKGEDVFRELDILPMAWEIPHYAASVLDYKIFGKIFEWTYHRPVIFDHEIIQDTALMKKHLMFTCLTEECKQERRGLLRNIKVEADYADFGAALYPYPIYEDVYGQSIIPETLGMVDYAFYSPSTWRPVSTPKDILRRAKKLKVIRGAMASFFWHPQLLNENARYYREVPGSLEEMGGKKSLTMIIDGLKELGYEFISISDCDHFPQKGCK